MVSLAILSGYLMIKKREKRKMFVVRLTKDLWMKIKMNSALEERSMNEFVILAIKRLIKDKERRLLLKQAKNQKVIP